MSDFLSDFSVIMFASLNVKLIMNGTWTWWVIHDGVWVDGGEPAPDWSIQNLAWRLQNDSTLWKREKIKKMKNAWKYKRYIKFKNYSFKLELTIRILVLWDCRVFAAKYHWKVTMIDMIKLISGVGYFLWLINYDERWIFESWFVWPNAFYFTVRFLNFHQRKNFNFSSLQISQIEDRVRIIVIWVK